MVCYLGPPQKGHVLVCQARSCKPVTDSNLQNNFSAGRVWARPCFTQLIKTSETMAMIKISNLEKIYRTEEVETIALNKLNVEVKEGEFVAVMGPSGCGKSTLLNILGLLDDPDAGSFLFNGIEVAGFNERKRADLRKHNIGFVFQSFNLIDELTVFENVELPLIYTGVKSADRKKRVEEVLDKMQIMHRRNHYPQQLSGDSSSGWQWQGQWWTSLSWYWLMSLLVTWFIKWQWSNAVAHRVEWAKVPRS